jgi:hypothetical protein
MSICILPVVYKYLHEQDSSIYNQVFADTLYLFVFQYLMPFFSKTDRYGHFTPRLVFSSTNRIISVLLYLLLER